MSFAAQAYSYGQPMPMMPMFQAPFAMPYAYPSAAPFMPQQGGPPIRYTSDGYGVSSTASRYEEPLVDIYQQDQPRNQPPPSRRRAVNALESTSLILTCAEWNASLANATSAALQSLMLTRRLIRNATFKNAHSKEILKPCVAIA
jgi:hypothetical protein